VPCFVSRPIDVRNVDHMQRVFTSACRSGRRCRR
jgi:hypothetical protein